MWLPLHTLVGSGEFYLVDELLKNNIDINAVDKAGNTSMLNIDLINLQLLFHHS